MMRDLQPVLLAKDELRSSCGSLCRFFQGTKAAFFNTDIRLSGASRTYSRARAEKTVPGSLNTFGQLIFQKIVAGVFDLK